MRLLPTLLVVALSLPACGGDPEVPAAPQRLTAPPGEEEPGPEPSRGPPLKPALIMEEDRGFQSAFSHPESLLKPMDGFPLPSGARLEEQGRDLAVYQVVVDLETVESFYRERGFKVTRPGKLPGLIITRTDTGTRLQVQPGHHRDVTFRFYR